MNKPPLTDAELWNAIKQDDVRAFDLLFEKYWSAVYSTAFTYSKDPEVCTDIVHDLFLNIWQKRATLEIQSFKAYLTRATMYGIYRRLKTDNAHKIQYIEDYVKLDCLIEDANEGDEKIRYLELESDIDTVINNLPDRCREIFILSRKQHLSNDTIAAQLGISKRSVENQITTALKYIRLYLKDIAVLMLLLSLFKK
jgi:RNA polymerase sigma-70 factor (family 1)